MTIPVTVVTDIPSPYQVELFDALSRDGAVEPRVVYLRAGAPGRYWERRALGHVHWVLDEEPDRRGCLRAASDGAQLTVFSTYRDADVREAMADRADSGAPWCFWGERPGARRTGLVGVAYRRVALATLHRSPVPIWGIGQWAIDGYRAEFGERRDYHNVPYFSDLSRFVEAPRSDAKGRRRLLFSGSLITRKGVDLLAQAFACVAAEHPSLELTVLGTGPLEDALRKRLGPIADRVRFLGFMDWEQLPAVYAEADALVAPSRHDGWGLIVPEALAAGLPVIGTDRMGAALELIEEGVNGWRATAGDLKTLTETLRHVASLSDDALATAAGAARHSVRQHQLRDGVERFVAAVHATLAVPA